MVKPRRSVGIVRDLMLSYQPVLYKGRVGNTLAFCVRVFRLGRFRRLGARDVYKHGVGLSISGSFTRQRSLM
jgi:hypothetical protein